MTTAEWTEVADYTRLPKRPVVSVHMITYNHGPYLAEAIEGVLAQKTAFPVELVIGEDCSTDNTREVALRYQKEYPELVRVIHSRHNVGPWANYVRTTDACRGEFIAFCEGDDYWQHPDKLQMQVDFLTPRHDYSAVHSDIDHLAFAFGRWRKRRLEKTGTAATPLDGDVYLGVLFGRLQIHTCTVLARGDLVRQYRHSALCRAEYLVMDWPLMTYLSHRGRIGFLDSSLATYRRTPGSLMNSGLNADVRRALNAQLVYRDAFETFGATPEQRHRADVLCARALLASSWAAGMSDAFNHAREALERLDPQCLSRELTMVKRLAVKSTPFRKLYLSMKRLRQELAIVYRYQSARGLRVRNAS